MARLLPLLLVAALAFTTACRADDVRKQGIEGELCNDRDSDCSEGHVCALGVCIEVDGGAYSCVDVCDKLRSCGAAGDSETCLDQCRAQFAGSCDILPCPWSDTAIDIYSACIVEDLTCQEIEDVPTARDTCFATLPFPEERAERCADFVGAAASCSSDANTPLLESRCARLARTTTDDSWSRTEACTSRIADGFCTEIEACFNEVFDINLELGEGRVDGDDIPDPIPAG